MNHQEWMRRALVLANQGRGKTSPNPMVGAILVKNGQVVGEGFHEKAGLRHAEIVAIEKAGPNARGSSLYVILEPCCHHGKTPPCTQAIIEAGISEVYASMQDPNPAVNGKGFQILREAGIRVEVGLLHDEARHLNEVFIKWISTGLPFIVTKCALTLDGKMATASGDSQWITGEKTRQKAREMRGWYDAVMMGINTVIKDDPQMTSRTEGMRNPLRVVVDSGMKIPLKAKVLADVSEAPTCVFASYHNAKKEEAIRNAGGEVVIVPGHEGQVDIKAVFRHLARQNITSVLVEGGGRIHGACFKEKLPDKVAFFISPKMIGDQGAPGPVQGWGVGSMAHAVELADLSISTIGRDVLITGYPKF